MRRYRISFSFVLPLLDPRHAGHLIKACLKKIRPVLGSDLQVHTEVVQVRKERSKKAKS